MSIVNKYHRFSRERFPLPNEAQLTALERRIKVRFPDEYRQFILAFNGGYFTEPEITPVVEGCPLDALTSLKGIGATHEEAELARPFDLTLFDDNDPLRNLPIGATAMGGLIILVTEPDGQGNILLKQAWNGFFYLAENIDEFFELLREREAE